MIKIMKGKWAMNKDELRKVLATNTKLNSCEYLDLVKTTFSVIYNSDETEYGSVLDLDRITQIDNGDYQGTLLFLIPFESYQPSETDYLMTFVGYGSFSGCDTLLNIQAGTYNEPPTETQLREYMALCKDIIANTIKPYNFGWRKKALFEPCEENTDGK